MRRKRHERFGKYRILRTLAEGGFAIVYQALDTVEGIPVALKVPHGHLVDKETLEFFRREARTQAALDHPSILPLKNAEFIGDEFVLVYPMGVETLAARMGRRMGTDTLLHLVEQMLAAVAHAHECHVIHCDIKPDNFILFPRNLLRLTDFGIARVSQRTVAGSGSGTIGYVAPDQAMGHPSFRSDVFSLGLILYEMAARELPEWPFHWPPAGHDRIRRQLHPDFLEFLRAALEPDPNARFQDAVRMQAAFLRLKPRIRRHASRQKVRRRPTSPPQDWKRIRIRQFLRQYRQELRTSHTCRHCDGPYAEAMLACPWCGKRVSLAREKSSYPARCPRCHRGRKRDWRSCAWCYGPGFRDVSEQSYSDRRYSATCSAPKCRGPLMPFMKYCPWCRRKVRKAWKLSGRSSPCPGCGWGVCADYWDHCPWCVRALRKLTGRPRS